MVEVSAMIEVSVLVPVRDGAAHLPATLRSLSRLLGSAVELVVVDDGSVDETPRLLAAAAAADPRFRILTRPPEGLVPALNAGLAAARGPVICRVDADDVVHPRRVVDQLEALRSGQWTVCGTRVRCFPRQGLTPGLTRYEAWQNALLAHDDLVLSRFVECPFIHPSVMFDAAAVRDLGGYRDMGWPEDYDLWLRLAEAGARFGKAPQTHTFWRDHPARVTRTAGYCAPSAIARCKAHFLLRGPLGGRRAWMVGSGPDAKRIARSLLEAGGRIAGWLDIAPRKLGQQIYGAPVTTFEAAARGADDRLLVAVGAAGRREHVRAELRQAGLREGHDFWCVA